jgi:hypothetical protein
MNTQSMPLSGLALLEEPPGMVAVSGHCSIQAKAGIRFIPAWGLLTCRIDSSGNPTQRSQLFSEGRRGRMNFPDCGPGGC